MLFTLMFNTSWKRGMSTKTPGLYANIHAKQERIAKGSKEKMRKPGEDGAPGSDDFQKAAKTKKTPAAKKTAAKKAPAKTATKKSS
jgi:hypothetical protein